MSESQIKTSYYIDINCDLGEHATVNEASGDAHLIQYISSCNIACGGHAGSEEVMRYCLRLAGEHGVLAGAHPSYPDKVNFGRRSMSISTAELKNSLRIQLSTLAQIAQSEGIDLHHVKPHGALYHDVADDLALAKLFVAEVTKQNPKLKVVGRGHSALSEAAQLYGLDFMAEAFIDRRYLSENRLVPRSQAGAVIEDIEEKIQQAENLIVKRGVYDINGQWLSLDFNTLCIHGDHDSAVATARAVNQLMLTHKVKKSKPL